MDRFEQPRYKNIMVIDDSKIDRYVVEMMIKKTNFATNVIQMESGFEALNFLNTNLDNLSILPELILLDVNMPEMNGFEFMEKFERLTGNFKESCQVMLLTSSIHPIDIDRASANKYIAKFINKPLNTAKISELAVDN